MMVGLGLDSLLHSPYAAALSTISTGVKLSPAFPPMVPLNPEIDFINVTGLSYFRSLYSTKIMEYLLNLDTALFKTINGADLNILEPFLILIRGIWIWLPLYVILTFLMMYHW